jgi:hypothetical protein
VRTFPNGIMTARLPIWGSGVRISSGRANFSFTSNVYAGASAGATSAVKLVADCSYSTTLEFRLLKPAADSPSPQAQNEDESKAEVRFTGGNALNSPSSPAPTANDVAPPAKEVTGNIARPPFDAPLSKHSTKNEAIRGDIDNYVSTGSIIVVIGALLFFFARQISRKLFWRNRGFY